MPWSLEKRLRVRPVGLVWKKDSGAYRTLHIVEGFEGLTGCLCRSRAGWLSLHVWAV